MTDAIRHHAVSAAGRTLLLGDRPWLMGIVNASPDSFSDAGEYPDLDARVALARELLAAGADLIDVGGESGITLRPAVAAEEEIGRVAPLVERLVRELGATVSVDTYKPAVAEAAIAAGAVIVNDVSGLRDPQLANVCARTGAALVLMHTRAAPKQRLQDPGRYDDVTADVVGFLAERIEVARARGVRDKQLILDPGPDFAKTPAQTIELLRRLEELHAFGLPLLLAVSRKDFVGALTGREPRARLAGTLAAIAHGVDAGAHILRVHDVAATADFLAVRAALQGDAAIDPQLALDDAIRLARG
ncbi:MAG TPA: dihydropteroate synthase [Solirubrobacteraceae bacterium]|jgi:dihydropteroate synthase|nr:dihydropteroate synthase [Solirubrobacteraceae bacterium]